MSKQIESFIAELARELVMADFPLGIRNMDENEAACRHNEKLREVLERRLKILLEAGQAMRDCNYINTKNSMAWDAAIEVDRDK